MGKLTMKSIIKTAAITAVLSTVLIVLGCVAMRKAARRPVINNTGATITQVYIRDSGTASWGEHLNRIARTTTVIGTCRQCSNKSCYDVSCEKTVYVKDQYGNIVYDTQNLADGGSYPYFVDVPSASDGQSPQLKSVDVKLVDANGFIYGKNNVNLTNIESIVITQNDMYPTLTMQNNTGFPINIVSPIATNVNNGSYAVYQVSELGNSERNIISYSIGDYRFDKDVMLNGRQTIVLTERPPTLTVQNKTGYPITITNPFRQMVIDGASSEMYPKSSRSSNKQIISYNSGTFTYNKEAIINDEDVVITLTEKDRPPIVTVLNNTGNTVNIVFLRTPGSNWPDQNMLTLKLKDDGTIDSTQAATQASERRGSITNKETFRFWLGNLNVKPNKYDVRLDDVKNDPYVKNNVQITKDTVLTFTQKDKP